MAIEQYFFIVLAVIVLQVELGLAGSYSTVEYLPGFEGPLPFQLQTGYVGVDEAEEVQLFYYFLKSEGNVKEDPLLLWLTGGPGCSALSGLLYEVGPLTFEVVEYNGSLPKLILNPHSWTKAASIIFVDMPVGTGFSYAKTQPAYHSSDLIQVHQADQFLRKWLRDHPEFLPSPVYIAGDSYSGIPLPAIVQQISNGNEEGMEPLINLKVLFKKKKKNLKGYILGNPITDPNFDTNSKVSYAHGMGLISDELYESLKRSCRGNYVDIEPSNTECLRNMQGFNKAYGYVLSYIWVNDSSVREALHIREGSIEQWVRCNTELSYTSDIPISLVYHVSLGKKGYRSLIYSGDQDMVVPFLGTQAWIRSLNYSIVDDWRPWLVRGQIAGYTRTYSNQMTFATVKGGGHTAPTYKPEVCFAMFKRWKSHEPL
ncbi:serine carboxypeptidase-like 2 isoform X3 [Jatropha curcas]|uniref:serine carboxypeptidase-like 2 isoform X3 n=1 Tax=Jatropha curcas TaxID=180498 RepID=UPI0005FB0237|nr:serine carboxypeptidase-like 2 isoform X3 [Jatropha curcas]